MRGLAGGDPNVSYPLLQALASLDFDAAVAAVPDAPAPPAAAWQAARASAVGSSAARVHLQSLADTPEDAVTAAGSALGPLLVAGLVTALVPDEASLADPSRREAFLAVVAGLPAVPFAPGPVLQRLRWAAPYDPDAVDVCAYALEQGYVQVPDDRSELLNELLGLPAAVGGVLDVRVFAFEHGARLAPAASPVTPLLVTLDRLGVRTVWDVPHLAVSAADAGVPVDVLAGLAVGLRALGAVAAAARTAVLLLRLDGVDSDVRAGLRELLAGMLDDPAVAVPPRRWGEVRALAGLL